MGACRPFGLRAVATLMAVAAGALLAPGTSRAGNEDLRPDNSLETRLLELSSRRRGQISGARVVEDRPGVLGLRIRYTGLEAGDLSLTARALDRRRRPLRGISEGRANLPNAAGEAEVRLELDPRAEGELPQRYLLVQIGGRGGRAECLRVFDLERTWTAGGGGGGATGVGPVTRVVAQPVGQARELGIQRPLTATFRSEVEFFKPAPANPTATTFRTRPGVTRDQRTVLIRDHRTGSGATPGVGVKPPVAPFRPIKGTIPCVVVGVPTDVVNLQGKGPARTGLLLSEIANDVNLESGEILSLHPTIFEDLNPQSGIYYYLPRSFHLDWNEGDGYALRMLYGASAGEAAPTVYISARLASGMNPADVTLAEKLVERAFRKAYPNRTFGGLKPYPISGMRPEIASEAYNIPKEKLVLSTGTDLAGAINLSLATDPVTKENLQAVLTQGLGLTGTVTMVSAAVGDAQKSDVVVPLSLKLGDRPSFGHHAFSRGTAFRNPSPYPVRLKYLHALVEAVPGRVYSYSLGDGLVAPGGSAQIDAREVRQWLDGFAMKMWVEYDMAPDDASHRKVAEGLFIGPDRTASAEVVFRTLTPLADTGAALIVVTISSRYLEPKGQTEKTVTLELNKDNEAFRLKPVYLLNRTAEEEKPGDPLYKYRLTVVKPDGTTKEGKEWISSSKMTVFIGSAVVKPILEAN